jgi:hypothetical protein
MELGFLLDKGIGPSVMLAFVTGTQPWT